MSSGTWLAERQIIDAGFKVEMSYPGGNHKLEIGNSTRAVLARATTNSVTVSVVVGTASAQVIRLSHDEAQELIAFLQKRVYRDKIFREEGGHAATPVVARPEPRPHLEPKVPFPYQTGPFLRRVTQ